MMTLSNQFIHLVFIPGYAVRFVLEGILCIGDCSFCNDHAEYSSFQWFLVGPCFNMSINKLFVCLNVYFTLSTAHTSTGDETEINNNITNCEYESSVFANKAIKDILPVYNKYHIKMFQTSTILRTGNVPFFKEFVIALFVNKWEC